MPDSVSAFSVVRVRPEAVYLGANASSVLPAAASSLRTHHGLVAVSWAWLTASDTVSMLPLPLTRGPPTGDLPVLCGVQPQFPIPSGGLVSTVKNSRLEHSYYYIVITFFFFYR